MYEKIVTVFNFCKSNNMSMWYPHIFSGVDLINGKGAMLKKYGPDSTDSAELHIAYIKQAGKKMIRDIDGILIPWLPPKAWKTQDTEALKTTITFGASSEDFFVEGIWDGGIVNEEDYRNGFYSYMDEHYDFCYRITVVDGPYNLIPHFEILGK